MGHGVESAAGARLQREGLGDRLALGHGNPQRARQHALDGDSGNRGIHFQVPLDTHQIQRQQILPGPHHGPAPDDRRRDHPVGADFHMLDGKGGILVHRVVQEPPAAAPEKQDEQGQGQEACQPRPGRAPARHAHLPGAQLDVEHELALARNGGCDWDGASGTYYFRGDRRSARSIMRWQSWP